MDYQTRCAVRVLLHAVASVYPKATARHRLDGLIEFDIGPDYKAGVIADVPEIGRTRGHHGLRVRLTRANGEDVLMPFVAEVFDLDESRLAHWLEEGRGYILTAIRDTLHTLCRRATLDVNFPRVPRLVEWRSDTQPGQLVVVGGSTGSGKTTLLYDMVAEFLEADPAKRGSHFFSADLSPANAAQRFSELYPEHGVGQSNAHWSRLDLPDTAARAVLRLKVEGKTENDIVVFDVLNAKELACAEGLAEEARQTGCLVVLCVQLPREEARWVEAVAPAVRQASTVFGVRGPGEPMRLLKSRRLDWPEVLPPVYVHPAR